MSDDVVASLGPVMYAPRHGQYNLAFDYTGTFVKWPEFAYQREIRMLWTPVTTPIEPFITTVPGLAEFCDIFATEDTAQPPGG